MFDTKCQQVIRLKIVRFPFHTERSPAKIQLAIASDSAGEFRRQQALNGNTGNGCRK